MRIFFVFCHTCLLVKASYLSHADTLRTRIQNYQKICDTQFLKKSENDRILKAVNSSNDQNKVSKAKPSNIRSVIDNYHNPDGKYNHKSFKRKISFCLPPETGTHAWSYFMMAIQKNISLYEVYEDYRAEKMGKRFFKTGFNTMLVLVPTVGTKVGTNFLNNQKKIDFFQRDFFFKGKFFFKSC